MTSNEISYEGIDEAVLIHALHHGTQPLGMGFLHNKPDLSVDDVRAELASIRAQGYDLRFDYYHGRPLKLELDDKTKTFRTNLYDRDAGPGKAARIVASLRSK